MKSLGEEERRLARKLELRKKQCHNLIISIKQMQNTLELGLLLVKLIIISGLVNSIRNLVIRVFTGQYKTTTIDCHEKIIILKVLFSFIT